MRCHHTVDIPATTGLKKKNSLYYKTMSELGEGCLEERRGREERVGVFFLSLKMVSIYRQLSERTPR